MEDADQGFLHWPEGSRQIHGTGWVRRHQRWLVQLHPGIHYSEPGGMTFGSNFNGKPVEAVFQDRHDKLGREIAIGIGIHRYGSPQLQISQPQPAYRRVGLELAAADAYFRVGSAGRGRESQQSRIYRVFCFYLGSSSHDCRSHQIILGSRRRVFRDHKRNIYFARFIGSRSGYSLDSTAGQFVLNAHIHRPIRTQALAGNRVVGAGGSHHGSGPADDGRKGQGGLGYGQARRGTLAARIGNRNGKTAGSYIGRICGNQQGKEELAGAIYYNGTSTAYFVGRHG